MSTVINPSQPEQPTAEAPKTRKPRKKIPVFELPEGADKLTVVPDDVNLAEVRFLRKHFKDIPCYKEYQAAVHEFKAKKLREDAAEWRINPPKRAAGVKRSELIAKMEKLEAKLKELGVDISEVLGEDETSE